MGTCMNSGAEVYISLYIFRDSNKTKRWYKNRLLTCLRPWGEARVQGKVKGGAERRRNSGYGENVDMMDPWGS